MNYVPRRFSLPKYEKGTKVCFIGNDSEIDRVVGGM